jgi:peptidoglycan/LPS O-acetylase OafA/YrhL
MIQRIQSIYLLIVVLLTAVAPFFLPIWSTEEGTSIFALDQYMVMTFFMASALLALLTIFMFKKRKLQFVLGRLNIILNFILLGFFVYWSLSVPGEMQISEKGIGMLIPVLSIVFLVLANKAVKKDEALVKSADRLR